MILNDTLVKFIKEFENNFQTSLLSPPAGENISYTSYFKIYTDKPKQKYSDWDIHTYTKTEEISPELIKRVDEFIRSIEGFIDMGLFMAFSDTYSSSIHQHVRHSGWLQYMAFMPAESMAPFLDLWIVGPFQGEMLVSAYGDRKDDEMIKWAAITAWRKIKNGDINGAKDIFQIYLNPKFPNQEALFINNPASFFRQNTHAKTSEELISFLNS